MRRRKQTLDFNRSHEKKRLNVPLIQEVIAWIIEIAIVLVLAFVLVYFLGLRTSVVGRSMEPTLYSGDEILVDRFLYKLIDPKQDDIIVFLPNGNEKSHFYVKRVLAGPGDTVQIRNGIIYINGSAYAGEMEYSSITDEGIASDPITLEQNEFFVIGDDPENSEDSRFANIGSIKKEYIIGKVWFVVSPRSRMGFL